jgi:hypothetical protein
LHGDHREIAPLRHRDAVARRVLADPREILVARAGIDDEPEPLLVEVVDDEIVDDAARLEQQAAVERLAGDAQFRDIVGQQPFEERSNLRAFEIDDAHVRYVEHARIAPHRVMLLDLRAVIDRHVPAAEVDHAGAEVDMRLEERCA